MTPKTFHLRYGAQGATLAVFLLCAGPALAQYGDLPYREPSPDPRNIAGAYMPEIVEQFVPDDGKPIPLTEWSRKILNERMEAEKAGKPLPGAETSCLPHGVPRVLISPYPTYIYQPPGEVLFLHEVAHLVRHVYLDEKPPADIDPTFMGYQTGHWDGDTLVIETTGQNDKTWLDRVGTPHSDKMRVTERWKKIKGGKQLSVSIRFEDPVAFTHPWTAPPLIFDWTPKLRQMEYVCEENNRNFPDASGHTSVQGIGQ